MTGVWITLGIGFLIIFFEWRLATKPDEKDKHQPRAGECAIVGATEAKSGGKRASEEGAIVEQDNQRRGDHDFFGGHAEKTGNDGDCTPGVGCEG